MGRSRIERPSLRPINVRLFPCSPGHVPGICPQVLAEMHPTGTLSLARLRHDQQNFYDLYISTRQATWISYVRKPKCQSAASEVRHGCFATARLVVDVTPRLRD